MPRGQGIRAQEDEQGTARLFEEEVDGRGLALALLLYAEPDTWLRAPHFRDDCFRAIGAAAGYDDDLLYAHRWTALGQCRAQGRRDIRLFVIGHDADTARRNRLFAHRTLILPQFASYIGQHTKPSLEK